MKILKKISLILSILAGAFVIVLSFAAIQLTEGFDSSSIDSMIEYISEFTPTNEMFKGDLKLMYFLYQLENYYHWIITGSIIWIVLMTYFLMKGNEKNGKNKKDE